MKATLRIPFEIIISDDIRFIGPSGEYVTIINELPESHIKRLIELEIDKQLAALSSIMYKERTRPLIYKSVKER